MKNSALMMVGFGVILAGAAAAQAAPATSEDATTPGAGRPTQIQRVRIRAPERPATDGTDGQAPVDLAEEPAPRDQLLTDVGVSIQLGGGVTNFFSEATRDRTDLGGSWGLRAVLGTRSLAALEAAYVGSAQNISAPGLDPDATLLGNGAEGALRLQLPLLLNGRHTVTPFALAGLGWINYRLVNDDFNNSFVAGSDNVLTVPLGAGIAFGYQGLIVDARFTYRPTFDDDRLFPVGDDFADLQSWSVGLQLGYEF